MNRININKSLEEFAGLYVDQTRPTADESVYVRGGIEEIYSNNFGKGSFTEVGDSAIDLSSEFSFGVSTIGYWYICMIFIDSDGSVVTKFVDINGDDGHGGFASKSASLTNAETYFSNYILGCDWRDSVPLAFVAVQVKTITTPVDALQDIEAEDIYDIRPLLNNSPYMVGAQEQTAEVYRQIYDATVGSSYPASSLLARFEAVESGSGIQHDSLANLSLGSSGLFPHVTSGNFHNHTNFPLSSAAIKSGVVANTNMAVDFYSGLDVDQLGGVEASGIVLTSGSQSIDGVKTFDSLPVFSSDPVTSGQLCRFSYVDNGFVDIVNNESVSGIKTFSDGIVVGDNIINSDAGFYGGAVVAHKSVNPITSGTLDLGSDSNRWNNVNVDGSVSFTSSGQVVFYDNEATSGTLNYDGAVKRFSWDKLHMALENGVGFAAYGDAITGQASSDYFHANFNHEVYDYSDQYEDTTSTYTILYDGIYLFNMSVGVGPNGSPSNDKVFFMGYYLNGSTIGYFESRYLDDATYEYERSFFNALSGSVILELSAGETIQFRYAFLNDGDEHVLYPLWCSGFLLQLT